MASPVTFQRTSTEQGTTDAYVSFTVGASGAVGAIVEDSGVFDTANITHVSAGLYKFPLKEQWAQRLSARASVYLNQVAYSAADGTIGLIFDDEVSASSPFIEALFVKADSSAAADPANGTIVELHAVLKWDGL